MNSVELGLFSQVTQNPWTFFLELTIVWIKEYGYLIRVETDISVDKTKS